jgi:hypothetical protein
MIFNNQQTSHFQKWHQGRWYSQWTSTPTGEHICTLYASIVFPESKIKNLKGKNLGWREIPTLIQTILNTLPKEEIQGAKSPGYQWLEMTSHKETYTPTSQPFVATSPNPFSVLSDEPTHFA